jgi:hypothetical protein
VLKKSARAEKPIKSGYTYGDLLIEKSILKLSHLGIDVGKSVKYASSF